jgi:hypothetical protein
MTDRRHLHLVDRRPPEEPRLNLRVSVFAGGGSPHGRSRAFRLNERDINELLRHAERLESRQ